MKYRYWISFNTVSDCGTITHAREFERDSPISSCFDLVVVGEAMRRLLNAQGTLELQETDLVIVLAFSKFETAAA